MEVLNAKTKINNFSDQKFKARTIVFFKQYQNVKLTDIFTEGIQKEQATDSSFHKFPQVIKDYESEKEKQIKNETCKGKIKSTIKTSCIYKRRQLKTIKIIDAENMNYMAVHHSKELKKNY